MRGDVRQLDLKIEQVHADLDDVTVKEIESRMTIQLGAMMVVAVGAVATLVKLL